jgi:hypothetical protein
MSLKSHKMTSFHPKRPALKFRISCFGFVSDFVLRISDLWLNALNVGPRSGFRPRPRPERDSAARPAARFSRFPGMTSMPVTKSCRAAEPGRSAARKKAPPDYGSAWGLAAA